MRVGGGGSAALQSCVFSNNVATGDPGAAHPIGGPAIGLVAEPAPSALWLKGCTFEKNESPVDGDVTAETNRCSVYSDVQQIPRVWSAGERVTVSPQWLQTQLRRGGSTQVTWGPSDGRAFLNEDTQEMTNLRQVG